MESLSKNIYLYQYIDVIRDTLALGKTFRLDIIGESMAPTLVEGDKVILGAIDTIKRGDIILYKSGETSYNLHRVTKVGDDITVIGDNNMVYESIDPSDVVALVTAIEKGKKIIKRGSIGYSHYARMSNIRRLFRRAKRKLKR